MTLEQGKCSVFSRGRTAGAAVPTQIVVVAEFPGVWETGIMAKRSLRILKRVSNVPSRGICECCNMQFSADPRQLGQAGVQQQFNAHKCDVRQNAVPIEKETAKVSGK
jgi:hypothetical protein